MDTNQGTTNYNNVPWQLDANGYVVCLGPDGQIYRSSTSVSDASATQPLKFIAIGALPANITGRQPANTPGNARFADREVAGAGATG